MENRSYKRAYDAKDGMGFVAGIMIGGLAGAVTMLLMAPQSGKETRAKIHQMGTDLRDQTTEAVDSATEQVRTKANQISTGIRDKAEELKQAGQGVIDGQKERWTPVVEAGQTALAGSTN